jgi:hypothetical protein
LGVSCLQFVGGVVVCLASWNVVGEGGLALFGDEGCFCGIILRGGFGLGVCFFGAIVGCSSNASTVGTKCWIRKLWAQALDNWVTGRKKVARQNGCLGAQMSYQPCPVQLQDMGIYRETRGTWPKYIHSSDYLLHS